MKIPFVLLFSILFCGTMLLVNCQGTMDIKTAQYYTNGHRLYSVHCANCHGDKGEGLGMLYPPLTDQDYLIRNREALPGIIQYGMHEEIMVAGNSYNMQMPANPQLSAVEIAYILTYVTNSFGNKNGVFSESEVLDGLGKMQKQAAPQE